MLTQCQSEAPPNGAHQSAPQYFVTVTDRFTRGPHRHTVSGAETLVWRQGLKTDSGETQRQLRVGGRTGSLHAPKSPPEGQKEGEKKGVPDGQAQPIKTKTLGEDIRSRTYHRLDSLEETIRELEISLMEIGAPPGSPLMPPAEDLTDGTQKPNQTPAEHAGSEGNKRPPVPPKPSIRPPYTQVHLPHQTAAPAHLLSCPVLSSPLLPAVPLIRSVPFEFSPSRCNIRIEF